jgi:hypothetical protein
MQVSVLFADIYLITPKNPGTVPEQPDSGSVHYLRSAQILPEILPAQHWR